MSDITEPQQPNQPSRQVSALDRLVGTWTVTGEAEGTVRYEWMPGRFFLLQHVELTQYGQPTTGLEVIGHLHPFGELGAHASGGRVGRRRGLGDGLRRRRRHP